MISSILKVSWYCAGFGVPVPKATVLSFYKICEAAKVAVPHGDTSLIQTVILSKSS